MDYTVPYGTDLFIAFQAVPAWLPSSVPPGQVNRATNYIQLVKDAFHVSLHRPRSDEKL
jgi:hypothetical protein